ncbi:hypothetical protein CPB84DRAFT_1692404 [Gymnopilus junonius]|uniref:Uncharacterized protein n=1 Tax=Gymnopilus junonius TaxID=109634 RepID=A0A9P5N8X7_GYMJU|nr:hypothetical protein CPB84DRAFT_1692404 [Gymnopilus junonius]
MIPAQQESKTQRYSRELADYTLRQFSLARSSLDQKHTAAISKLPAAYSRVAKAEKLVAIGETLVLAFCHSD